MIRVLDLNESIKGLPISTFFLETIHCNLQKLESLKETLIRNSYLFLYLN